MKLRIWPWSKKVIERGFDPWQLAYRGMPVAGTKHNRPFVIYEVTNHWTGSITLEKQYLS